MLRGGDDARAAQGHIALGAVAFHLARTGGADPFQDGGDRLVGADADDGVHLGDLLDDLLLVALGQTAGDHHFEAGVLLLVLAGQEDVLDGFGLGRLDEPAGVDEDRVGLRRVGHSGVPGLEQRVAENVGVHLVFRAAERNDGNIHRYVLIPLVSAVRRGFIPPRRPGPPG